MSELIAIAYPDEPLHVAPTPTSPPLSRRGRRTASSDFVHELWQNLPPGHFAVIVLMREVAREKFPEGFRESGLRIHTTLGDDVEAELAAALEAAARR
jgi:hypothetical protein